LWVGPLTIIVAALVNLVIRAIAVAFFGVPDSFVYLQAPFVIGSTLIFLLLALLAFVLVGRKASRPVRFYRILGLVALFVSFLFPVQALTGLFPAPGMNLSIFWTMIVMHTVTAIITVGLLTTLAIASLLAFILTLYLQGVLGFTPLATGLVFLPAGLGGIVGGQLELCCKKSGSDAMDVKAHLPVQLRQPLQTGWR